jgi:hypothetical protein
MLFRQHHAIGLKYCAPRESVGKRSAIYICQGKDYDLKSLHPKMRNKVRQGLRNCAVRPITFEYLHDYGMRLNRDTLKRQGRDDLTFSQSARWERLCQAGQPIEGAGGRQIDVARQNHCLRFAWTGSRRPLRNGAGSMAVRCGP